MVARRCSSLRGYLTQLLQGAEENIMTTFYVLLQFLLYILWLPFQITMRLGALLHVWAQRAGDFLVRPLYWNVVQAKRRGNGSPLWQQHDWQIGIGPPCEHCKKNVPPERHENGCKFVLPREKTLSPEEIAYLAGNPVTVSIEEQRLTTLRIYVMQMKEDGIAIDDNPVSVKCILSTVVKDMHIVEEHGVKVSWEGVVEIDQ